jgi:hypothetical protein
MRVYTSAYLNYNFQGFTSNVAKPMETEFFPEVRPNEG